LEAQQQMLGTVEKLITIVGAPVTVLYSLGFLAFVTDLWVIEYEHGFRFLAAWHAVGLIDREVILASGTVLLIVSLIIGFLLLQLFAFSFEEIKKSPSFHPILRAQRLLGQLMKNGCGMC
jgi:hypothetical protein